MNVGYELNVGCCYMKVLPISLYYNWAIIFNIAEPVMINAKILPIPQKDTPNECPFAHILFVYHYKFTINPLHVIHAV